MPADARHVHARGTWRLSLTLVLAVAAVVVCGGIAVAKLTRSPTAGCVSSRTMLQVVASPDIAPAVAAAANSAGDLRDAAGCTQVQVQPATDTAVIASLAKGTSKPPDVWIATSSLTVRRAGAGNLLGVPTRLESIASSPLVLSVAGTEQPASWSRVLSAVSAGRTVLAAPGMTTPSTVGLLLALRASVEHGPNGRAVFTGLVRSMRLSAPSGEDANVVLPATEQAVWSHHRNASKDGRTAVYLPSGATPFDYPFAELGTGARTGEVARRLLAALRGGGGQHILRTAGFRGIDGAGIGLDVERGVDGSRREPVGAPDIAQADSAVNTITLLRREARLLAVVDVSGSMANVVPASDGQTRLDLAARAATAGLALYPDETEVGLWEFSQQLTNTADYRQLLRITRLGDPASGGRAALDRAVAQMHPIRNGGTALYNTTLAAVRAVRAGWDPARVNAVVLLTDGEDTDSHGLGLTRLLSTLRAEQAGGRPVPVITIAYGPNSGTHALAAISRVTHGASYHTSDPNRIRDIFPDAIGQRACRPNCSSG